MEVTLIRVGMSREQGNDAMKPLIFSIVADLTPPGLATVRFLDDRVEEVPLEISSEIIALSVETFAAKRAYQLARQLKRPGNLVVMGGFHPTVRPDECLVYCDSVLIGDAEDTWPGFLRDVSEGRVQKKYSSSGTAPLRYLPEGNCYTGKRYQPVGVAQFSRGCRFHCDFCSVKTMYPGKVRQKPVADIVAELRRSGEKLFFFIDDNLFHDEDSAIRLFRAIQPLKKRWACQISLDIAGNDRLLKGMKDSGCIMVLIGFESLNQDSLRQMNKTANLAAGAYEKAIANIYRHGLMIYATFVLGYDGDTAQTIRDTARFAMEHSFAVANFNPLIPMPGTPLYRRLEAEGRLLYDAWWLEKEYRYGDTAYLPAGMTGEQLAQGCKEARYSFYSWRSIFARWWKNRLHRRLGPMLVYLLINLVSRKEIRRKQGKRLGESE